MNNTLISRILLLLLTILLFAGFGVWTTRQHRQTPGNNEQYYRIVAPVIPDTLSFAGEPVPLDLFYVKEALDRELSVNTYWHSSTLQLMRKSTRWFPVIEKILEQNGIPPDFKYLCVIESGFANVVSPAGATGFWQLMKGTAKDYGLQVDKEVDERYDVEKSTRAACKYFQKGHDEYKNWTLVAAAYNAGQNGINKLMEIQKANSYYDLLVSDETSRYLYRILAFKMIFENPERFGFYLQPEDYYEPIPYHTAEIKGSIESWADFAKKQGISYKLLKYFNPWLRQPYLKNKKKKTYEIRIPDPPYNRTYEDFKKEAGI